MNPVAAAVRSWPRGTAHRHAARAVLACAKRSNDKPSEDEIIEAGYDAGLAVMLETAGVSESSKSLVVAAVGAFGRCRVSIEEPEK